MDESPFPPSPWYAWAGVAWLMLFVTLFLCAFGLQYYAVTKTRETGGLMLRGGIGSNGGHTRYMASAKSGEGFYRQHLVVLDAPPEKPVVRVLEDTSWLGMASRQRFEIVSESNRSAVSLQSATLMIRYWFVHLVLLTLAALPLLPAPVRGLLSSTILGKFARQKKPKKRPTLVRSK